MSAPSQESVIWQTIVNHVPEARTGVVEAVSIAREPGNRVAVAVRSVDSSVHPVSVISAHLKDISRDLGGEKVSIVLWSQSPELFILYALAPYGPKSSKTPKVTLIPETQQARVHVSEETLDYFSRQDRTRLSIASRLVGWDIQLVCHERQ